MTVMQRESSRGGAYFPSFILAFTSFLLPIPSTAFQKGDDAADDDCKLYDEFDDWLVICISRGWAA